MATVCETTLETRDAALFAAPRSAAAGLDGLVTRGGAFSAAGLLADFVDAAFTTGFVAGLVAGLVARLLVVLAVPFVAVLLDLLGLLLPGFVWATGRPAACPF